MDSLRHYHWLTTSVKHKVSPVSFALILIKKVNNLLAHHTLNIGCSIQRVFTKYQARSLLLFFLTWSFSSRSMFCFFSCTFVFSNLSSRSESSGSGPVSSISSCRTWYSTSYACSCFEMSISVTWWSTSTTLSHMPSNDKSSH